MQNVAASLHQAVSAVCPINSISIGRIADKTTWRIEFTSAATDQQRVAAQAVVDAFDPTALSSEEVRAQALEGDAQVLLWEDKLKNATNAQIDSFFAQNVTTPAAAINVLKAFAKILAMRLK